MPGSDFLRRIREAQARGLPISSEALAAAHAIENSSKGIFGIFRDWDPFAGVKDYGQHALNEAAKAALANEAPGITQQLGQIPSAADLKAATDEASRGVKAAAAILGVAVLGASVIAVLGKERVRG